MNDKKAILDNTILEISKILEKHKNKENIKIEYSRIENLKNKRNINDKL